MRKFLLAAVATLAMAIPAVAQDHACITPDMMQARAAEAHMPVFYTLRGVDLGLEDKAEVIIFESDTQYLAVAFSRGCYVDHHVFDQMGIEDFINDNTKKAGDNT